LPTLGLGVSTEYGANQKSGALDPIALRRRRPEFAAFLEVGIEISKGLDEDTQSWLSRGWPCTYHFLDINLDEPEDFDDQWMAKLKQLATQIQPAWLCGDAGMWHFGPRERGHMLLLPPILTEKSARAMATGIARLREATGLEVFPENPPGTVFVGDMGLLEFFGLVAKRADTGLLLDCAHLAIYQRMMGRAPLEGLDQFPLHRVIELHVAGGIETEFAGLPFIEDSHTPNILPETWTIFSHVVTHAPNLKAVVFECERNRIDQVIPKFEKIHAALKDSPLGWA